MKHYNHLTEEELNRIFFKLPCEFDRNSNKKILAKALGATLYSPATRTSIAKDVINRKYPSLTSMVLDLEDAVGDNNIKEGEDNLIKCLNEIDKSVESGQLKESDIPILFLRVRNPKHFKSISERHTELTRLTGFVFPKFSTSNAIDYLETLKDINKLSNVHFYGMPILESKEIIYIEHRTIELINLKKIIDHYKDDILNIRIGGTDFSSLFSIRRTIDTNIYDVIVVKDCLKDILNFFNRAEDDYTVSGVVWEFIPDHTRVLKPSLREKPFVEGKGKEGKLERMEILHEAIDGLIKEVLYDKLNGFVGKTIIHPTHITYVNALQAVTYEEYMDAFDVVNNKDKGVLKSSYGNKMNEVKPHYNWSKKILEKAEVYGVLRKGEKDNEEKYNYNWLF